MHNDGYEHKATRGKQFLYNLMICINSVTDALNNFPFAATTFNFFNTRGSTWQKFNA